MSWVTNLLSKFKFATYAPTVTPGGSMTGTFDTTYARYMRVGKLVVVHIRSGAAVAGTGANTVTVSLPVNASRSPNVDAFQVGWFQNPTTWTAALTYISSATEATLFKTSGTFTVGGAALNFGMLLVYEAA
jgi:hypothetical protein